MLVYFDKYDFTNGNGIIECKATYLQCLLLDVNRDHLITVKVDTAFD